MELRPDRLRADAHRRARDVWSRLRASGPRIAQVAGAAGAAWVVAHDLLHHPQPFFAPIAAIVALTAAAGQRGRLAVQMMVGVVVGIAIAHGLVSLIGVGAWELVVVVALAIVAALLLGESPMLVNQAAAS